GNYGRVAQPFWGQTARGKPNDHPASPCRRQLRAGCSTVLGANRAGQTKRSSRFAVPKAITGGLLNRFGGKPRGANQMIIPLRHQEGNYGRAARTRENTRPYFLIL